MHRILRTAVPLVFALTLPIWACETADEEGDDVDVTVEGESPDLDSPDIIVEDREPDIIVEDNQPDAIIVDQDGDGIDDGVDADIRIGEDGISGEVEVRDN